MYRGRGFTLIEVLVALAIVAIALMAGLRATGALTHNAQRQGEVFLANICASNALAQVRMVRTLPGIGESTSNCEQGGRTFQVRLVVQGTPNPSFRRVDAHVSDASGQIVRLTTVVGQYW